jgi:uridine phosphorylase
LDHLGLTGTEARCAVLTGDPDRAKLLAEVLGSSREVATRRGFAIHETESSGVSLLVVASGIGAPSTAIAVEELAQLGVHTIVRVGTCGAIQPSIEPLSIVVSTGSVRDEGTTRQYVDLSFPAVPDIELTAGLIAAFRQRCIRPHVGITHSKDAYYSEKASKQLLPSVAAQRWQWLRAAGVLATEMEASALFVLGSLRLLRTAAVLISVGAATRPQEITDMLPTVALALTDTLPIATSPLTGWEDPSPPREESYLTAPEETNS